jgi:translation initiation factor IF-3
MKEYHISEPRINDRIRVPEVRLVGPNGEQVGIVRVEDALRLAQEADLDLVEVAPQARPPVCKLMDFGKFKYESAIKDREARKNQAHTVLKEIRLRLKIDPHDYGTKKGHVERFLNAGDKVKVMIMFRGREQSRPEMGYRLLQRMAADVAELGYVESTPKQDGRNMIMVIGPHKKKADTKTETKVRPPRRLEEDAEELAQSDGVEEASATPAAPVPVAVPTPAAPVPDEEPIFVKRAPLPPSAASSSSSSGPSSYSSRPPSSSSRPPSSSSSRPPSSSSSRPTSSGRPVSGSASGSSYAGPSGPSSSSSSAPVSRPASAPSSSPSTPSSSTPAAPVSRPAPASRPTPAARPAPTPGPGATPGTAPRPGPTARPMPGPPPKPGPAARPGPSPTPGPAPSPKPKDEAVKAPESEQAAADA